MSQINLQHGTTTVESSKTKKKKTDMLRSIGKVRVSPEEDKVRYGGKDLQKKGSFKLGVESEGVMDDEVVS